LTYGHWQKKEREKKMNEYDNFEVCLKRVICGLFDELKKKERKDKK
jgi:hypothetical protein